MSLRLRLPVLAILAMLASLVLVGISVQSPAAAAAFAPPRVYFPATGTSALQFDNDAHPDAMDINGSLQRGDRISAPYSGTIVAYSYPATYTVCGSGAQTASNTGLRSSVLAIQHRTADGKYFYTVFKHLSIASGLAVGSVVKTGQWVATVAATACVHAHFELKYTSTGGAIAASQFAFTNNSYRHLPRTFYVCQASGYVAKSALPTTVDTNWGAGNKAWSSCAASESSLGSGSYASSTTVTGGTDSTPVQTLCYTARRAAAGTIVVRLTLTGGTTDTNSASQSSSSGSATATACVRSAQHHSGYSVSITSTAAV